MKRNRNGSKRRKDTIQVWTRDQALRVVPYVASIVRSLRDHRLEAQRHHLAAERLANRPGRPDKAAIIAHEEALRGAEQAEDCFQHALEELHTLDVYCLDPLKGQALIPFASGEQLAWYIFDLFDSEPLKYWRFHEDPLETRRPFATLPEGPSDTSSVAV